MSEPKADQDPVPTLDEAEVAAYLQANPDFLQRHPAVLEALDVRHDTGSAVSLIERQVASLRRDNHDTHARLRELIDTARDNETRVQHLNGLARVLLGADDAEQLVTRLREFLKRELRVDAMFIGFTGIDADVGGIQALPRDGEGMQALTNLFRRGKPICGPLTEEQVEALFADAGDTPPQSAALIPLGEEKVQGALVLGSRDSRRFVPDMGTLFLELMGNLITAACRRHLGSGRL
ncbi:DUF484 family protein [Spectribacter hydrogenooxidans]|uniref:DUF484 family protein n=1 Tax=Spectribacter hydrogenoxidans TaxID=3075608 RepID=A0ABU3BWV4_9GAMM|nr:DUF484 family protein [Salinisphaera sp. W335]MDT0633783.1 DUF484 family protein [Salinisphaera sp. W335]